MHRMLWTRKEDKTGQDRGSLPRMHRMLQESKTMENKTKLDGENTARYISRAEIPASNAWSATLWECSLPLLEKHLILKLPVECRRPGSRPTLCASLRNRNTLGHAQEALYARI